MKVIKFKSVFGADLEENEKCGKSSVGTKAKTMAVQSQKIASQSQKAASQKIQPQNTKK